MEFLKNCDDIGTELFHMVEKDMKNVKHWIDNEKSDGIIPFCFAYDGETKNSISLHCVFSLRDDLNDYEFFLQYCEYYWECVCDFFDDITLEYRDVYQYNKLWWELSKFSINIFTPFYTKEEILQDNPLKESYEKLNQYVITVDSQTYLKDKLSPCHPTFLEQCKLEELKDIPAQTIQRPYVEIICPISEAKKLCEIYDDNLLVGYVTISDNKWSFNSTFKKYCDVKKKLCVTKVYFPSIYEVECTTHVYYGNNDPSYIHNNIYECTVGSLDDYDRLALVFIVYRHWNCDYHLDPTKYMFDRIINCFN